MSDKQPTVIYGGKLPHYLARPVEVNGVRYDDVVGASIAMGSTIKQTLSDLYSHAIPGVHFIQSTSPQ